MTESHPKILGFRKPPILLVGSGMSRRYGLDAPCWMELLERIGRRIGITDAEMVPLKNDAERNCGGTGPMPRLATELQIELDRRLRSGRVRIEDMLSDDELSEYASRRADAVKIMAATECRNLRIDPGSPLTEELEHLRRLPDIIPCVITTNYDTMLEDDLFGGRFKVYSDVSDYYLSGSQGIGEVYKIHGTCTDPGSMVLNEEDYMRLRDRSKIVSAKILSVLCDYPMVILGYGMEDSDVKGILDDLISSLNDDKLREVERNIVLVVYDPGEPGMALSTRDVEHEGHVMSIRAVRTSDFTPIFAEISSMEASVSPETIRKIRQVVRKIQVTERSKGDRYKPVGIDDITREDADRLVVVITDQENMRALETVPPLTVDDMIKDILGIASSGMDPEKVVRMFASYGPQMYESNEYVPIFHYMNHVKCPDILNMPYVREFISSKEDQFQKKLNRITMPRQYREREAGAPVDVRKMIDESRGYLKPLIVMHLFEYDELSESESLEFLRYIYMNREDDGLSRINMKCAVSYVGFRKFIRNGRDLGLNC